MDKAPNIQAIADELRNKFNALIRDIRVLQGWGLQVYIITMYNDEDEAVDRRYYVPKDLNIKLKITETVEY